MCPKDASIDYRIAIETQIRTYCDDSLQGVHNYKVRSRYIEGVMPYVVEV